MRATGNWQQQYDDTVAPQLLALALAAQTAAAQESDGYVADVLNELAFGPPTEPGVLNVPGFVGVMGDGRPVETLLRQSVVRAGETYNALRAEMPETVMSRAGGTEAATQALESAEAFVDRIFHEIVAETARAAESAATAQREWVEGWVRMLNPPGDCSRCVILAGRFYLWNAGFERHPLCNCTHIPASERTSEDLRLNPGDYFDSLPTAAELDARYPDLTVKQRREGDLFSQEDIFTKAGAQAIRDGADLNQVVNARRGMRKAQIFRHDALITSEGTTRRALAFRALSTRGTVDSAEEFVTRRTSRGRETRRVVRQRARAPRLMPESLYEIADGDRAEAIRLLKANGFIL